MRYPPATSAPANTTVPPPGSGGGTVHLVRDLLRAGRLAVLSRNTDRVPRGLDRVERGAVAGEEVLRGLQRPHAVAQVRTLAGLHQHRVVHDLDGALHANTGNGGVVAGRAGRLSVGRVGAL